MLYASANFGDGQRDGWSLCRAVDEDLIRSVESTLATLSALRGAGVSGEQQNFAKILSARVAGGGGAARYRIGKDKQSS